MMHVGNQRCLNIHNSDIHQGIIAKTIPGERNEEEDIEGERQKENRGRRRTNDMLRWYNLSSDLPQKQC
jgi:hypothetical protein